MQTRFCVSLINRLHWNFKPPCICYVELDGPASGSHIDSDYGKLEYGIKLLNDFACPVLERCLQAVSNQ